MYYLELIQKFWDFNQKAQLNTTAIAMYLYLLKLGHDANGYQIIVSDVAISNALGLTRKTVKPTKEKLQNLGLLQFENNKGLPCSYRLILNYSLEFSEQEQRRKQKIKTQKKSQSLIIENTENAQTESISIKTVSKIAEQNDEIALTNPKFKANYQPSWEEFMEYAKSLDSYEVSIDPSIKEKYDSWTNNDWKNALNRPINNWKSSLKSTLPYMKNKTDTQTISLESIPNIKRPKSSIGK